MEGNQKPLESPHAIEAESLTAVSSVLDRQYLHFTDTPIKQYSESQLIISNPFSVPIKWKIIDLAPPFVKESPKEPDAIYRANYSVFWIHQYNGHLQPQQETQVLVTFQPQDIGQYSQVKDIELVVGKEVKRFKISMGGKGIDYHQFQQRALDVKENLPPLLPTPHPVPGATPPRVKRHTGKNKELLLSHKQRKVVYLSDECVTFPSVGLGEESVIKIRVFNKDTVTHKFEVIDPHPPFTVLHRHFELTPRHCARLPIYYAPTVAGSHQSVLAIRTLSGHQMFTLLKGTGAVRDH
ncbi:PREDICTED: centrosomal protein of 192 kDa-like [Amphimedon queenslandica]|nr:PREDICTED: centrosomal protein of 192 kDa-like [Amphimedon queenslandica]|eukprot:XP_019850704.1 PREDICTED: centrosomal protein of 192 kDa-like [Amphimedon queenslandica]